MTCTNQAYCGIDSNLSRTCHDVVLVGWRLVAFEGSAAQVLYTVPAGQKPSPDRRLSSSTSELSSSG